MTDGSIIYDDAGHEIKKFSTRDGAGFFAAKKAGIKTMVLTGRECSATVRRMSDLDVDYLMQDVSDKGSFLLEFCKENGYSKDDLGYIGDELNDISAMRLCGFVGCPSDSCEEVLSLADYVSSKKGGEGVVRDIIEKYLREQGIWDTLVSEIYRFSGK